MCLQDLRIQKGLALKSVTTVIPASGVLFVPDHRRAYMIWGFPATGKFNLSWYESPSQIWLLPARLDLGNAGATCQVFTAESFGGVPPGQLCIFGTAADSINYMVAEYDAGVDAAVTDSLRRRDV